MGRHHKERVLGPYRDGASWKIIHVAGDGTRTSSSSPTKAGAEEAAAEARAGITQASLKTCGEAIDAYEVYLRVQKRLKPRSIAETVRRLRLFLPRDGAPLRSTTAAKCSERYAELAARFSVDTHRNVLNESKTFLRWCVDQWWLVASPAEGLKGVGRRRRGKPQLRLDEARRWSEVAFRLAAEGDAGAVAALTTLYLDLRASEVISREVRDLDDGGRVLWIPDSKSDAGRRVLEIPKVLRPLLLKLAGQRPGNTRLFGDRTRGWVWRAVAKCCELAKVPRVGAHSMRGLHATLAVERGATGHQVALAMGHASQAVTYAHYATRESVAAAKQGKVVDILARRKARAGR